MLDKVENIQTGSGFRGGNKKNPYTEVFKKNEALELADKDALVFSPAALYLSKLLWLLHEIDYPGTDRIFIDFSINHLRFQTEIDFLSFYSKGSHTINLSKILSKNNSRKKYNILLRVQKNRLYLIEDYKAIDFKGLDNLVNKISDLLDSELINENPQLYKSLIKPLQSELYTELQYIFAALFTFINKLGKFNVIKNYKFTDDSSESVIIEKIDLIRV